jgi:hypothetical protein
MGRALPLSTKQRRVQRDLNEPLRPPYDGALSFETSKRFRNGGIDMTMYLRAKFYY